MLQGTLDSFSLPDVLGLLDSTQKTGVLRLQGAGDSGALFLSEGQVYDAFAQDGTLTLARRLVGSGVVPTDLLRRAATEHAAERGLALGRLLVDEGALDEDSFEVFVREQVQDSVFHLMRLHAGSFTFEVDDSDLDAYQLLSIRVPVETIVLEARKRLEAWADLSRRLPSMQAVVTLSHKPEGSDDGVRIRTEEWRLLTLVDGRRTVRDLVLASGQGEYQTCTVLQAMLESGTVEVGEGGRETAVASVEEHADLLQRLDSHRGVARPVNLEHPAFAERPWPADLQRTTRPPADETLDPLDFLGSVEENQPAREEDDGSAVSREAQGAGAFETDADADRTATSAVEGQGARAVETDADADRTATSDVAGGAVPSSGPQPPAGEADEYFVTADGADKPTRDGHDQRVTTDPSIDHELVERLIAGVEEL